MNPSEHILLPALASLAFCLAEPAAAQRVQGAGEVVDRGTYHLASGTLTPPTALGPVSGSVVYDNSCPANSWFLLCGGEAFLDDGRVPSPTSVPLTGDEASYRVNALQIGYVTSELDPTLGGLGATARLTFWEDYHPCALPWTQGEPTTVLDVAGLPGSFQAGIPAFVVVTIDLTGSGREFCLRADADGVFDDDPKHDSFGWTIQMRDATSGPTGALIAGDPALCGIGDGTRWQNAGVPGTGLGNSIDYRLFVPQGEPGCGSVEACYSFGSLDYRGFHLVLWSDSPAGCADPGEPFCLGDDCFCGNVSSSGGCANSTLEGALLAASGSRSIGEDDLVLETTQLPADTFCLMFAATQATPGFPFGSGRMCLGGGVMRLLPVVPSGSSGAVSHGPGLVSTISQTYVAVDPGDTLHFQLFYRDPSFCVFWEQDVNMSNGYSVTFVP